MFAEWNGAAKVWIPAINRSLQAVQLNRGVTREVNIAEADGGGFHNQAGQRLTQLKPIHIKVTNRFDTDGRIGQGGKPDATADRADCTGRFHGHSQSWNPEAVHPVGQRGSNLQPLNEYWYRFPR